MTYDLAFEAVKRTISPAARVQERQAALNAAREALKLAENRAEAAPGPDFRASAFVGAWERIGAAQKLKVDPKTHKIVAPLPELYWATLAEAAVLADLARTDEDPGRDAGRYIADLQKRTAEPHEAFQRAKARRDSARPQMPEYRKQFAAPFTVGHRVRVNNDVMDGKYAGRPGTVTKVGVDDGGGWIEVALDKMEGLSYSSSTTITVRADGLGLV